MLQSAIVLFAQNIVNAHVSQNTCIMPQYWMGKNGGKRVVFLSKEFFKASFVFTIPVLIITILLYRYIKEINYEAGVL